jgi:DNA recombination protein RmuC
MSTTVYILSLIAVGMLALLAGWLLAQWRAQKRLAGLRETNTRLETTLEMERHSSAEKLAAMEQARAQLSETFSALSSQALKHNSEEFLKLARENLRQFNLQADNSLATREKNIEQMIKPIRETLHKTEQQMREIEKERKEAYGALHKHLESMARAQEHLQGETRNLVQALRRPEVRGQWGEMTLRRVVELAGMVEHCDFYEQEHVQGEGGALRPDMVVRMPDGREIVVDVKTPLDAYLSAAEAPDEAARMKELDRHARKMRERVRELSGKAYWSQFRNAPDFVVLFIPGEQFLSAALERDRDLLEDALRAVAYGWRQEALAENADKIRELGEELYKRLATFTEHLGRLGKTLGNSVEHYNKAVGSLERQVIPSARKMGEMGIRSKKQVEEIEPLDKNVRKLESE